MFLYELFPPELIKIDLESEDKDEAFEEMVDLFCRVKKTNIRKDILAAIHERESKMSTGIYKGIAMPHGKTNVFEHFHGVLGISKKGIDYDALDNQPVYIIFLLLGPLRESENHLKFLKKLSILVSNPHFYSELLDQKNTKDVQNIIRKYEDILISE